MVFERLARGHQVTFRYFLKRILRPIPGFAGMLRRREQLREQARTIETLQTEFAQAQEQTQAAVRAREQADSEKWAAIREREHAETARWEAIRGREQADAEKWDAIRQREQAEEGRWQAVREREQADAGKAEAIRERDQLAAMRAEAEGAKHLQWKDAPHLEKQGLFVVGHARSGTTVLMRALNSSRDIFLLGEANLALEGLKPGFARWYNQMHAGDGKPSTKDTFCPVATSEYANGVETLNWLSQRFRYVGEKIAFRSHNLGYDPQRFFEFHARNFFLSHYVCVIRHPADVLKSSREMFKPQNLLLYADSYLQTLLLILAFAETLPNVHVLFHESINQHAFDVLGERFGVDLSGVYEANYHQPYQVAGSRGADHTGLPWLMMLGTAHQMMRDAFSTETLRETPNHPTWMMLAPWIREMREKLHTLEPRHLKVVSS